MEIAKKMTIILVRENKCKHGDSKKNDYNISQRKQMQAWK